jgi:hypothetical protein
VKADRDANRLVQKQHPARRHPKEPYDLSITLFINQGRDRFVIPWVMEKYLLKIIR